jgi:hypothetical protein
MAKEKRLKMAAIYIVGKIAIWIPGIFLMRTRIKNMPRKNLKKIIYIQRLH